MITMSIERPHQDSAEAFGPSPGEDELTTLYVRLVAQAEDEGLLDVAYRTLDTPVGTLLLAATPTGLVRVAYEREGLDAVLQNLAGKISPRILRAPPRLDEAARQLDDYFAGRRTTFDLRARPQPLGRLPPLGAGLPSGHQLRTDGQLPVGGRRSTPSQGGAGRRHGVRHQPPASRHPLPPGHPLRRTARRLPRWTRDQAPAPRSGSTAMTDRPPPTPPHTGGGSTAATGQRSQLNSPTSAAPSCHACSPSLTPVS